MMSSRAAACSPSTLNFGTGSCLTHVGREGCDLWTPAFYNGVLYSYVQGSFVASDPGSGALLWNNAIRGDFSSMLYSMNATAALDGTHAYLVSPPQLAALNIVTQDFDWIVSGSFTGTPAVADGVVYAISGGAMIASDATTGAQLFTFTATRGR